MLDRKLRNLEARILALVDRIAQLQGVLQEAVLSVEEKLAAATVGFTAPELIERGKQNDGRNVYLAYSAVIDGATATSQKASLTSLDDDVIEKTGQNAHCLESQNRIEYTITIKDHHGVELVEITGYVLENVIARLGDVATAMRLRVIQPVIIRCSEPAEPSSALVIL